MKAAIFHAAHQPLTIEEVEMDVPMAHEVVVRVVASGVCHSDYHYVEGLNPIAAPVILGHEGAGIVEQVGELVTYLEPGDHVISCPSLFCGLCEYCLSGHPSLCRNIGVRREPTDPPRYTIHGDPVNQFANLSTYAEKMLVHENALVKIPHDMPLDRAALIGCGVTTGVGAALNTAKVAPGSTVAVFGTGGVGLSAIQGARIAGARMIIAVDVIESKLATARRLGATHVVDASSRDPVEAIKELTGDGVDYSFEAIGIPKVAEQCFDCLKPGGTATIIGVMPAGQKISFDGYAFLRERKVQGSLMGSNRFRVDMPRYIDFYRQGRLNLDDMITRRGKLEDINEAFRAMGAGEVARSVLIMDPAGLEESLSGASTSARTGR